MNDDNIKSQTSPQETQAPEYKPKVPVPTIVESSIKPLRTFEMDMASLKEGVSKLTEKVEVKSVSTPPDTEPTKPIIAAGSDFIFEKAISMTEARQKNALNFDEALIQSEQAKPVVAPPPPPPPSPPVAPPIPPAGFAIPKTEDHPLHILHNQTEAPKPFVSAFSKPKPPQNIRTYESDIAKVAIDPRASLLTMALAESQKRGGTDSLSSTPSSNSPRKFFFAILSLFFITTGVLGGYYLYTKSPFASVQTIQEEKSLSIAKSDSRKVINLGTFDTNQTLALLSDNLKNTQVSPGTLIELLPSIALASSTRAMSSGDFMNLFKFKVTDTLKRSIVDTWMIGVSAEEGLDVPFVIITTDFFQNAFAGMIKWETTMPKDFADLFSYRERLSRGYFEDKIVMNRDVREFINEKGEVLLLYSFLDKNTILITTSEALIPHILERIEKQTYIR